MSPSDRCCAHLYLHGAILQRTVAVLLGTLLASCSSVTPLLPPAPTAELGAKRLYRNDTNVGSNDRARPRRSDESEIVYGSGEFVRPRQDGSAPSVTTDGDISLNFVDADVRHVAQSVLGDVLGENFVVDREVDARITLRTNRPLPRVAAIATLETTLAASGLALIREKDLYRVLPAAKTREASKSVRLLRGREPLPPGYGVTAVHLKHVSPSQMARVLEPLAAPNSVLSVDDQRNLLILAGIGSDTSTLLETVDMFDVDTLRGMSFGYFKLSSAKVSAIRSELATVMNAHAGQAGIDVPQLVAINRLNALLVISSRPATLRLAEEWIEKLDAGQDESNRQLYVYHVKNRKAQEMASVLSDVFFNGEGHRGAATRPPSSEEIAPDVPIVELTRGARTQLAVAETNAGTQITDTAPDSAARSNVSFGGTLSSDVRIVPDLGNNSLLIRATKADYDTLRSAIEKLDITPPLIMIDVTIAEIKLQDGLKFGIEWFFKDKGSSFTFSSVNSGDILSKFPGFSYFFSAAQVATVLNAMSELTDVRIVSSPKVMVRDSKTATLQIGDQIPVVTSTAQSVVTPDAPIVQTVRYFDTGVILKVTPQVNARGLVTMDVTQEVSNVANQTDAGISSPTIQQRKISSSIAIQSGEAVFLGGLMRESRSRAHTAVPFVAQVPVLGEAFKTSDNDAERTELLIIITPRVVWGRTEAREITNELRRGLEELNKRDEAWHAHAARTKR